MLFKHELDLIENKFKIKNIQKLFADDEIKVEKYQNFQSLETICLSFEYAFAERNYEKLLEILDLLVKWELYQKQELQPFFSEYHTVEICLEMFKMSENIENHLFILKCICAFSALDISISIFLELKGYINFIMKYFDQFPQIVINTLLNIACADKKCRDSVIDSFSIKLGLITFKNNKSLRFFLLQLFYNFSLFEYDNIENAVLNFRAFYVMIKKRMIKKEFYEVAFCGIHHLFKNLKNLAQPPFKIRSFIKMIANLIINNDISLCSIASLIFVDFINFNFQEITFADCIELFKFCIQVSSNETNLNEEFDQKGILTSACYMIKKSIQKGYCNQNDFFPTFCLFKTIFECNILPFTAKTELYNASALFIVLSDSKVISQMIENNIIDIILEGLEFPNNQLFLLAVDKLVSFSENSSTKLDFSMILEVLNQNDDCNSEKYHYLINRLNAIEGN